MLEKWNGPTFSAFKFLVINTSQHRLLWYFEIFLTVVERKWAEFLERDWFFLIFYLSFDIFWSYHLQFPFPLPPTLWRPPLTFVFSVSSSSLSVTCWWPAVKLTCLASSCAGTLPAGRPWVGAVPCRAYSISPSTSPTFWLLHYFCPLLWCSGSLDWVHRVLVSTSCLGRSQSINLLSAL